MYKPKLLVFDIETTDLKGDFGHLLTAAATWVESDEMYTWRIDDHPDYGTTPESMLNDAWIAEGLRDMVNEADALIYHYGDRFDLPFLNTRLLDWGLEPCSQVRSIDTWKVARSALALTSNRLGNLAAFLNDPDAQKGGLTKKQWKLAAHGDKATLDAMLEYNIGDVVATEQVYLRLRPLMKNHPFVAVPDGSGHTCPACGSNNSVSQGSYYTKRMHVRRRRCKECGTPFEEGRSAVRANRP
jgi:uncharacterized protein YprB with RNaseH-like and TPR domain